MSTVVLIPHEKIALELCVELVKQGKTFRCEKTSGGLGVRGALVTIAEHKLRRCRHTRVWNITESPRIT